MKRVLITGAGSYIGTKVEEWLKRSPELFVVDAVDTLNDNWKKADFSKYDVVYNVAGIAHVKAKKGEGPLYYKVNRDMVIEIAKAAKAAGVKQFIHMSSMIVYKEVKTLKGKRIHKDTEPKPNGFYGDSMTIIRKAMGFYSHLSGFFPKNPGHSPRTYNRYFFLHYHNEFITATILSISLLSYL